MLHKSLFIFLGLSLLYLSVSSQETSIGGDGLISFETNPSANEPARISSGPLALLFDGVIGVRRYEIWRNNTLPEVGPYRELDDGHIDRSEHVYVNVEFYGRRTRAVFSSNGLASSARELREEEGHLALVLAQTTLKSIMQYADAAVLSSEGKEIDEGLEVVDDPSSLPPSSPATIPFAPFDQAEISYRVGEGTSLEVMNVLTSELVAEFSARSVTSKWKFYADPSWETKHFPHRYHHGGEGQALVDETVPADNIMFSEHHAHEELLGGQGFEELIPHQEAEAHFEF